MPVLRPLAAPEVDALVRVQRDGAVAGLAHIFPQDTHPFPIDVIRQRWLAELADPAVDCFVIVLADRIAGFAATRGNEFFHFGTAVDTWGSGLAVRAHDEIITHLRDNGHRDAWLRVFETNQRAIRFYVRRGWTPTNVTSRTTFAPFPALRRYERSLI
jgi:GNAT superfamily N-acetyltransferase